MNIFHTPAKFGLRVLGDLHVKELNTQVVIWIRDDYEIFWGFWDFHQSRTIFEDVGLDELESGHRWLDCVIAVQAWAATYAWIGGSLTLEVHELLGRAWKKMGHP